MPYLALPNAKHFIYYERRESTFRASSDETAVNASDDDKELLKDTALVFLHHATGSQLDWRDQLTFFSENTPFQCIAFDRVGFGRSIPEVAIAENRELYDEIQARNNNSNKFYSDHEVHREGFHENLPNYYNKGLLELYDVLNELKLSRIILIGHSDGATLGLLAAAGLGSSLGSWKMPEEMRVQLEQKIVALVAESPHMWYEHGLDSGFEQFERHVEPTEKFWRATIRDQLTEQYAHIVVNRWKKTWVNNERMKRWDERHTLPHIGCPSLVIHGVKDPFFTLGHSREIVSLINRNGVDPNRAKLVTFDHARHTPHREAIVPYNETVLSFINQHKNKLLRLFSRL